MSNPNSSPKRDWRAKSRRHKGGRRFGQHRHKHGLPSVPTEPVETCPQCEKALPLCVCAAVSPVENKIFTLILRHPQEPDVQLGTAHITTMQLANSMLKTGLSWPSLSKIMGQEVDPKRWGILFLGTSQGTKALSDAPLTVLDRKGEPEEHQKQTLQALQGIVLLDGTWSQAKALWWRNAWMLKCRRLVLNPPAASLYGNLRREPRRESVSTIEAAAYTLATLEGDDTLPEKIFPPFKLLLEKVKQEAQKPKPKHVQPKPAEQTVSQPKEPNMAKPTVEVSVTVPVELEVAPVAKPAAKKVAAKKPAKKIVAKKPAAKKAVKKPVKKSAAKPATKKPAAKKVAVKKVAPKKAVAKKHA